MDVTVLFRSVHFHPSINMRNKLCIYVRISHLTHLRIRHL